MKKAIIFPGQGAQYPKMGLDLSRSYPAVKGVFDKVDSVLGFKISDIMFAADASALKDTRIQQLAILAFSLAVYRQSRDNLGDISFLSGLSLGEYSCLYAAGALSLEEVVILVNARACAMQKAAEANPSVMLAVIGAGKEELEQKAAGLNFYIANINAPSQVVVSAAAKEKDKLIQELEGRGLRVIELEVSGGFHSPFMEPAREELGNIIAKLNFSEAKIPIVSNVTAAPQVRVEEIKENLLNQLVKPVLWMDSVRYMESAGVSRFFEVGPSRVLKGLLRKIDKSLKVTNIEKNKRDF